MAMKKITMAVAAALAAGAMVGMPTAAAHPPDQAGIDVADLPYVCAYLKANDGDTWVVAVMAQKRLGVKGEYSDVRSLIETIADSGVYDS